MNTPNIVCKILKPLITRDTLVGTGSTNLFPFPVTTESLTAYDMSETRGQADVAR